MSLGLDKDFCGKVGSARAFGPRVRVASSFGLHSGLPAVRCATSAADFCGIEPTVIHGLGIAVEGSFVLASCEPRSAAMRLRQMGHPNGDSSNRKWAT